MKKKLISITCIMLLIICSIPVYSLAATRDSVKAGGDYRAGSSVYGAKLTSAQLNQVADVVADFMNQNIIAEMPRHQRIDEAAYYLASNCVYAADWAKNGANTAWGALIYKEAQCSGYARGFKALCDGMGVPCYYVHSSTGSHQWNIVQLENGDWRHIDVQLYSTSGSIAMLAHTYLADDADMMANGYQWDRTAFPACTYSGAALLPEAYPVSRTTANVVVDGKKITADAYNLYGSNYFKLRDIAMAVNGTDSQFGVAWNDSLKAVTVNPGESYAPVGGEMTIPAGVAGIAYYNSQPLYKGSEALSEVMPININGNNYFRIRDLGNVCGFTVDWNQDTQTIAIGAMHQMTEMEAVENVSSYLKKQYNADWLKLNMKCTEKANEYFIIEANIVDKDYTGLYRVDKSTGNVIQQ